MIVELGLKGQKAIAQALRTIILTSKGEIPFRPNFGLGAEELLGGASSKKDITKELIEQVNNYEKRIKLYKINVADNSVGQVKIALEYIIKSTGERHSYIQTIN